MEIANILYNRNNTNQKYKCPEYIIALLRYLELEIDKYMFNKTQVPYESPFENTGNTFETDKFKVQAYNWNTDTMALYNFIYYTDKRCSNLDDIKISWYKHLGRDTTINEEYDYSVIIYMFNDCIKSIRNLQKDIEE